MATDPGTLQQLAMLGLGDTAGLSQQQIEDALYGRTEADINRRSFLDTQAALENTFARGVGQAGGGPSSVTGALIDPIERARTDALTKARMDAFTAAQAARQAALGQAAGAAQQAITSSTSAGAQQQALNLQQRGQNIAQSQAQNQMLGQGLGGLGGAALSTAGLVYAPEIRNRLRGLLGADAGTGKATGNAALGPGNTLGPPSPNAGASGLAGLANAGAGPSPLAPSFGAPSASAPSFTPASYEMPSSSGFGTGGGLGNLSTYGFDSGSSFSPGDWGLSNWLMPGSGSNAIDLSAYF